FADLASRVERHRLESAEMADRIVTLRASIAHLEYQASTIAEEKEKEEKEIADITSLLEEARQRADLLATQLSDLNRHAAEIRDSRAAIEVQRAEAQARLTFVRENCASELNQSLEELAQEQQLEADFDLEVAHARVEELRARIEAFGGVNMMALDELAENEARLLFLT